MIFFHFRLIVQIISFSMFQRMPSIIWGSCDEWDEEKYRILKGLGLTVEILFRKTPEEKGITASLVRSAIATDQEWAKMVPKSVYRYITEHDLDERIKRLEQMRIDEKDINRIKD